MTQLENRSAVSKKTPLVSIIVPVCNAESTIVETLDSATNQTYENVEVLVIDDGSTDGTQSILDEYKEKHDIKIIRTVNRGVGAARNTGLACAKGEYIKFLDADDKLPTRCIEVFMKYNAFYDADVIKCTFDSNINNVISLMKNKWVKKPIFSEKRQFITNIYPLFFTSLQMNNIWTLFMKKSVVKHLTFRTDMTTGEDCMFVIDLVTKAKSMLLIPDVLYEYNQRTKSSISRKNSLSIWIDKMKDNKDISESLINHLSLWGMNTRMYYSLAVNRSRNNMLWRIDRKFYDSKVEKERISKKEQAALAWEMPVAPKWIEEELLKAMNGETQDGERPDWKTIKKLSNYYELRYLKMSLYNAIKRIIDFVIALIALIILAIPMLIVSLLIYLTDGSPVIYKQTRLGRYGRPFTLYKFRSMPTNAEQNTGAVWAAGDDDRATGIGRLLRLTKVDELPQLINILKGEMSFVGPRPERPEFYQKFLNEDGVRNFEERILVQPGLTGLAQITKGTNVTPKEKLELDLEYIKKRSLWFDTKMFFGTLIAVPKGKAK